MLRIECKSSSLAGTGMLAESGKKSPVPERPGPKKLGPKRPTLKSKKTPIYCVGVGWTLKGLAVCVF